MAHTTLTEDVADIIRRSTIKGCTLTLPAGHIAFYAKVKKALEAAGGKWNRSAQGFVFPEDPAAALGLALERGKVEDKKVTRQAFYTPRAIAEKLAELAEVAGLQVLEPSAGHGALAGACLNAGAASVHCIEIESACGEALAGLPGAVTVHVADFLAVKPPARKFDRVVMNPPFTRGQDLKHVRHALQWLKPRGALYAILPDKECPKFEALGAETVARFPAGAFKESGTSVATRAVRILKTQARGGGL